MKELFTESKRKEVYMAKKYYSWATEKYSDNYSEAFETIEECIKEAKIWDVK